MRGSGALYLLPFFTLCSDFDAILLVEMGQIHYRRATIRSRRSTDSDKKRSSVLVDYPDIQGTCFRYRTSVQSDALDLEYESQAMKEKPSSRKFPISLSLLYILPSEPPSKSGPKREDVSHPGSAPSFCELE